MTGERVPPPLGPAGEIAARFIERGRLATGAARVGAIPITGRGDIFVPAFGRPLGDFAPPAINAGGVMQFPGTPAAWAALIARPTRQMPNLDAMPARARDVAVAQQMAYLFGTPFEHQSQQILQQGILMQQQVMMQQMLCNQMMSHHGCFNPMMGGMHHGGFNSMIGGMHPFMGNHYMSPFARQQFGFA